MSAQAVPQTNAGGDPAARFSGRFFDKFRTDELVRIRTKLNEVLVERARQFDLFECNGVERQLPAPIEQVWLKQAPASEPASETFMFQFDETRRAIFR